MENNSIKDIIAKFSAYKESQWVDWIEDILESGYAYPEYRFLPDGEPLRDVIDYLNKHNVFLKHYEQAFSAMFEQYSRENSPGSKVDRLLDVMPSFPILIQRNKRQIFSLFFRPVPISKDLENGQTMQSQLMFILSKMKLEEDEFVSIKNHIFRNLSSFLFSDAGFMGNFLRFVYRQKTAEVYFLTIRNLLRYVKADFEREVLPKSFLITVAETMVEYSRNCPNFNSAFSQWLIRQENYDFKLTVFSRFLDILFSKRKRIFRANAKTVEGGELQDMLTSFLELWAATSSDQADIYTLVRVIELFLKRDGYNTMAFLLRKKQEVFKEKLLLYGNDFSDESNHSVKIEDSVYQLIESTLFPANIQYHSYTPQEKERYRRDPAYRNSQRQILGKDLPRDPEQLLGISEN
jgi:hypothetical protein